jgi:hypothetical protein
MPTQVYPVNWLRYNDLEVDDEVINGGTAGALEGW